MSVIGKKWKILNEDSSLSIWERLLLNRGLEELVSQEAFLEKNFDNFHDPYLLGDMHLAVERIDQALNQQEKIVIFGDYDVDGITSTAILYLLLKELGGVVSYRLPHRMEDGYGLNEKFINELVDLGVDLIITVDCGISCAKEIDLATSNNVDVIVTDHHQIPETPPNSATAILHPKLSNCAYPERELTGAGVAFKLASALITKYYPEEKQKEKILQFTDLASLGTVADCAPILGENRLIVQYGLSQLKKTIWPGLAALQAVSGIKPEDDLSTYHIGFLLAPRINAAGRIDHPYYALQMLLSDKERALQLAKKLDDVNKERQDITAKITEEAETKIFQDLESEKILIAAAPHWHAGIIGLVAGKLAQKHMMPAIIMQEQGEKIVGSCRGPVAFDFAKALASHAHLLDRFGGHKQAAGFTLLKSNLDEFTNALKDYAKNQDWSDESSLELIIDSEINLDDFNQAFYDQIDRLNPFGIGNAQPAFLIKGQKIKNVKTMGNDGKHLSGAISRSNLEEMRFVSFGMGEYAEHLKKSTEVDLVCTLELNRFRGRSDLELRVIDFKPTLIN